MPPRTRVLWTAVPAPSIPAVSLTRVAPAPPSAVGRAILAAGIPRIADATTPKQDAIGLLQLAAEVEHALLVQYLYAAASIDATGGTDSQRARGAITQVAIQEMGHLVCVQNLLLALGGRDEHHLGRDSLRATSDRNPLPLVLEPLSHAALAKFVTVERPGDIADAALRTRVECLALEASSAAHFSPHPVSALYAALYWIFQPTDHPFGPLPISDPSFTRGWHLTPADFLDPPAIDRFATTSDEWAGFPGLIVRAVRDATSGCNALFEIMAQGEGVPGDAEGSHFEDFLGVLDGFEANLVKTIPLCRSPRVNDQPPSEDSNATTLTDPYTEPWARLFNIRYTHLVFSIGHALFLPIDDPDRAALVSLALSMMRPALAGVIRQLSRLKVDAAGTANAGPPFGLLDDTLPSEAAAFWVRHRTALSAHANSVAAIKARPELATDSAGRLLLQQIAAVNQPLVDLVAAHP